jgi:hypothetical protein
MITYEVDILDVKTAEAKRVDSYVGWTQWSPKVYRENMCDCNLAGCRNREVRKQKDGQTSVQAHESAAYRWRELNGPCDHGMPPKRMKAIKAYLQDGRVYDFEKGEFE